MPGERTEFFSNCKCVMFKTNLTMVYDQTWKWLHTGGLRNTLIQQRLEGRLAFKVGIVTYKPEHC